MSNRGKVRKHSGHRTRILRTCEPLVYIVMLCCSKYKRPYENISEEEILCIVQFGKSSQGSEPSHPFKALQLPLASGGIPSYIGGNGRVIVKTSGLVTCLTGSNKYAAASLLRLAHV